MSRIRLTIVETHPIQYNAPWFRYIARECRALDLTVLYASRPTPVQQAAGYAGAFEWDRSLLDGYNARIVRASRDTDSFVSDAFGGIDVPEISDAIVESRPDVALVPGWHSRTQLRAIAACRRRGIPLLYRGDTHLGMRPAGLRGMLWPWKTRALLRQYDGCLAVGTRAREYLLRHGVPASRIFASPHSVDNAFFAQSAAPHLTPAGRAAARSGFGFSPEDFVVLFVGRFDERKRLADLIEALARQDAPAALLVVGSGDNPAQQQAAATAGVRIHWAGFLNQRELGRAYAAADCLALPSVRESWGLVVNEAMATGLPAVVSDRAGCAADLVSPGETGEIFSAGNVADLAGALARVRACGGRGAMAEAVLRRVAHSSFEHATTGLVAAAQAAAAKTAPRVIACCGGMVVVSGLERMTFEVLRVVRERGGRVHCIVNGWENFRIVPLAERIGASWSIGFYNYGFTRRTVNPIRHLQSLWNIIRTSGGLLRDALTVRPTHVLVPEYAAVLRNAPALALLRLFGVEIVFRVGNAPERGSLYDVLWRRLLPPFVTTFVPNSRFGLARLQDTGVPPRKITLIRNALSRRAVRADTDQDVVRLAASRRTLLTAGQIAPFKGTHLAVDLALDLLAHGCDVQAIIAGAIPTWPPDLVDYVNELRARVERAGAAGRVHFVGPRENVTAIMRASYLLVAPILQEETFGNVVLEARSVGLPVVTFDRGALAELVTHRETGYVCPTADLAGLREGVAYFLDRPAERARASDLSIAAADGAGEDCTPAEFERRWWALFAKAS